MGTFIDLFARLGPDPRVRGKQFEHVCKWFLSNDPTYKSTLRRVWLWDEWPGRWGGDAGIDLVAEDYDGRLWAIQSKAYSPENAVTKADVDRFLSESSRPVFSYRLLIATSDKLHHIARRTINEQEKQVAFVGLSDLLTSKVNWHAHPLDMRPSPLPKAARPREHQREAIRDVLKGFAKADRGQLIMACGTGKTLTSLFIKEKLASERTLVLVPSLSLLKQTMQEWTVSRRDLFESLPVCSDETVGRSEEDAALSHTSELGVPVTTDPHHIATFLRRRSGPRVVFSTYQSSPQIAAAFAQGRVPAFDLVIADEAHRIAGIGSAAFGTALNPTAIRARRRLFMTATPRYFTGRVLKAAHDADLEVASMDDPTKFGTVFHRLSFGEAIKRKLLTDYQVAVVGVDNDTYRDWAEKGTLVLRDGERITDARTLAGQIGLAKAMRRYDLHRMISFHSRVARAREFAAEMPGVIAWMPARHRPKGALWSRHASGEMSAGVRHVLLQHLSRLDDDERGLLTNARCLSEGVDVPTLDGVAFIDPRRSEVDIVQAVGRAIRKSKDKTVGTIVIPVFIDTDENPETALEDSAFKPVWDVIKALRSHDDELAEQLDTLRLELGQRGSGKLKLPDKIHLDLPKHVTTDFARAFDVRLISSVTTSWLETFGVLHQYYQDNGTTRVPQGYMTSDGYPLGSWVSRQRALFGKGKLPAERIEMLSTLGDWSWNPNDDQWEEGFRALEQFVKDDGHALVPKSYETDGGLKLGDFVSNQRVLKHSGKLSPEREERLGNISGWEWDVREARWKESYSLLRDYHAENGALPVFLEVFRGVNIGKWVNKQRALKRLGRLSGERINLLEAIDGWEWDDGRWKEGLRHVQEDLAKGIRITNTFKSDGGYPTGQWVNQQRSSRRKGKLPEERIKLLEAIDGWEWDLADYMGQFMANYLGYKAWTAEHGHEIPAKGVVVDGYNIGNWIRIQRRDKRSGKLSQEKIDLLDAIDGFDWEPKAKTLYTAEENEIIGRDGISLNEICRLLPHRTPAALKAQRSGLRLAQRGYTAKVRSFTREEDKIISQKGVPLEELKRRLERIGSVRTVGSIRNRRYVLSGKRQKGKRENES